MAIQRYSKQRELIYNTVRGTKTHPTAEMVYAQLKPDHPNLSLGTVYRNLHLLADEGKIARMPFPVERFDGDVSRHAHFCCQLCGRVDDVFLPYDEAMDASVGPQVGTVSHHATVFYGLCPACHRVETEGK